MVVAAVLARNVVRGMTANATRAAEFASKTAAQTASRTPQTAAQTVSRTPGQAVSRTPAQMQQVRHGSFHRFLNRKRGNLSLASDGAAVGAPVVPREGNAFGETLMRRQFPRGISGGSSGDASAHAGAAVPQLASAKPALDPVCEASRKHSHFYTKGRDHYAFSSFLTQTAFAGAFCSAYAACMGGWQPKVNPDGTEVKHRVVFPEDVVDASEKKAPWHVSGRGTSISTKAVKQFFPAHPKATGVGESVCAEIGGGSVCRVLEASSSA